MRLLRTNTATRVTVGPFIDKTDGITPEVALSSTDEHVTFVVDTDGVPTLVLDIEPTASGGNNDLAHVTNDDAGFYDLELTAANLNYLGRAMLSVNNVAAHCPVFHEFHIVPADVYDALVLGTDTLDGLATTDDVVAVQTALTALINNLPTTDELDTALAAADDAVLAAIAALPTTDETAAIADAVWDEATAGLTTAGSIGKLLTDNIDTAISSVSSLGTGAVSWTVTITDGTNPIDGVDVWVTTDSAGANTVARGITNASGEVVFMLDTGTYYTWKQLAGYTFTNPETLTVA